MTCPLLLVLALGAVLATGAAPAAGSTTAPASAERAEAAALCLGTGAPWRRGSSRGDKYVLSLGRPVTCAFARTWVARLSAKPARRTGQRLTGPRGFNCLVTLPYAGKAAVGACGGAGGEGLRLGPEVVVDGR